MSKYHNAFQGFVKVFTGAKQPGVKGSSTTIIGVAPSKNIKKFQEQKEKIIKTTDAYKKKVNDPEIKKKMNETTSKTLGNISQILKGKKVKKVEKKAMGGRIGLKGGGNDMGSTTNKSINSLKNILENRKNRKKSKISSEQEEQKNMALQRVKDRPYNPVDDFDTYKKRTQAMGGNVYTAAEMKSKGGRIGYKSGNKDGVGRDHGGTTLKLKNKKFFMLGDSKKDQKKYYDMSRAGARDMNKTGQGEKFRDATTVDKKTGQIKIKRDEKKAMGGRIGRKLGGGMSDTQVKRKYKNLGNLPESIQIKIAGKKIAKKV